LIRVRQKKNFAVRTLSQREEKRCQLLSRTWFAETLLRLFALWVFQLLNILIYPTYPDNLAFATTVHLLIALFEHF
jgi:hypothetical protein